jgi:hypothetical protein
MITTQEKILSILAQHQGKESAINAEELFRTLKGQYFIDMAGTPDLRAMIREMRQRGELIASCSGGYYVPVSLEEALEYVELQFRAPSRDQLYTARIQREAAKQKFGGQMVMDL